MLRILIVAIVLLVAAYLYLHQGGDEARPLEAQQQALEKAKDVEQVVQQHAADLHEKIDEQAGDDGSR